ncbi:unnamed protein product [Cuscuta campestris]|uniref:Morc S5 domain-containing protein n=1 Tax=Cuscuta campestris TaxID=132261 RepID=A0A484LCK6_9ASTE|nr:unnamed protein product [Cuscuta campestris]
MAVPPKRDNLPVDIVEIDSSDDEGGGINGAGKSQTRDVIISTAKDPQSKTHGVSLPDPNNLPPESRSFWKAGNIEISSAKSVAIEDDVEHARVHPKFLHSNATSHKWAFGAIAELLDNAVDEINSGATFVKVDRIYNVKDNSPALLFHDDGGGLGPGRLRKCMSLGYSSKTSNTTIGQYGNGFKTSTMRLGADVIVLTRSSQEGRATQSVGLLSYTFLRRTGQNDVIVPMIDFDISGHWAEPIIDACQDDWSTNLKTILEWSPFASKDELMQQFEDIGSHGTKVIIFNLWLNDEGIYELNFDDDDEDIKLRDEANQGSIFKRHSKRVVELQSHISYRFRYSLRAYASILYLRKFKKFSIILRGKAVEQYSIGDGLQHSKVISYKPQLNLTSKEVTVDTTIGFIKEAPHLGVSGFNIYHKNRLIRPFWKVTADGSAKGNGVVGVLEANFIEPAHDKQDFERSTIFYRLETRLKQMIMEYWKACCHLVGHTPPGLPSVQREATARPQVKVVYPQMQSPMAEHHPVDSPVDERSIDMISEDNIQLFMRCEAYIQKKNELKKTIVELERELDDTRMKCADISSQLESQKKIKGMSRVQMFEKPSGDLNV